MNNGPELVELNICNGCKYLAHISVGATPYCNHQDLEKEWKFLARPVNTLDRDMVILTPNWCPILMEMQ